ncbi:hypothetical protein QBA54_31785 [Streptomyces sp. B21-108]|uniref:hypothetical protein n=1 Tax=Streptomyces sp. B21-108 TaxID=3039419 RepID=UPI002FF3DF3E
MTTTSNTAVSSADTEQRITALAGALYVTNAAYAEALTMPDPAATLDDICDAWPEIAPQVLGVIKATPEMTKVLVDAVADRLWAYTVVEHARAAADPGYRYVFGILADGLKKGGDPASVRADVQRVTELLASEAAA